ncbi:MAG: aldo/keto reductase [Tannerellaceae bacterium]|jgi:L-glyceraldehyde 3-phosphate reductase|nr:aldo/keto reductase [Tannerellaceae bacterium]
MEANEKRYDDMLYRRCGRSGILLPAISLGLWHNFGSVDVFNHFIKIAHTAFDNGITHFDLANNYGPEYGSAEENFGKILKKGLGKYRDELIISSKAGYDMWPGPYGNWGSRKYLTASLDRSLQRMGLDYVDIFYSHRPDPCTPIEETMGALVDILRQGKALYAGISNYNDEETKAALAVLKEHKVHCLIHQPKYSMLERWVEPKLLPVLKDEGVGLIAFSPLAQGLLTDKYLNGIPENSRAAKSTGFLQRNQVTEEVIDKVCKLNDVAVARGQTLAEMALAWLLKDERITSVLVGASSVEQLLDNLKALRNLSFAEEELNAIEAILS